MNVLAQLDSELKEKNWTIDEKMRYLYLRSCELFSYDPRFLLCSLLPEGKRYQKTIKKRTIDLENVDLFWLVCTSFAKEVYKPLLKQLLNKDCDITGIGHEYVVVKNSKNLEIVADGTYGYDLTRVKMNLSTYGYHEKNRTTEKFREEVKKEDIAVNYITEAYANDEISNRGKNLWKEFLEMRLYQNQTMSFDEFQIYRMKEIKKQVDTYTNLTEFSDLQNCISYIQRKFLFDDYWLKLSSITLYKAPLLIEDINSWEFVNIYPYQLENDMIYYALVKEKDHYMFQQITKADAISYSKNYEGNKKSLIYHK